ncbi:MAG: NAD(P)-dependent oxidoreductase [Anaerolineae bacterium]|nr:NAD(P)-dependent oxidoreductase [Anaerolineae bacterium]
MTVQTVCLFGASGTMGLCVLRELWQCRDRYRLVLLLRRSKKNMRFIRPYAKQAGLNHWWKKRVSENQALKLVWGDATRYEDVCETIRGADWVLDAMALISPYADYYPAQARAVNTEAIKHIVSAIEEEPGGAERIRLIYTGTVAETGDRLPPIHWGRVGDPLKPSIFDYYAVTKIAGERCVLESNIRHWASLRMTFIMPTNYRGMLSLMDPILFHQPLRTCMENISDRDAGRGMALCLQIPDNSSFWRGIYNMGGGPSMRCTAWEFMDRSMQMMGLPGIHACTMRRWFALRNFHMQYFLDSSQLNDYLHYWRDSLQDCWSRLERSMPLAMKILRLFCQKFKGFQTLLTRQVEKRMRQMAEHHRNGTAYWVHHGNTGRISAFYGVGTDVSTMAGWEMKDDCVSDTDTVVEICHGYNDTGNSVTLAGLVSAAVYRGGECQSLDWNGDLFADVRWRCARGHTFIMKPNTVLKGGHWCPDCAAPPWDYDREAQINPFFAQVWYPNHHVEEKNVYPEKLINDIAGADRDR